MVMDSFTQKALELANRQAPGGWTLAHLRDYESLSDGCSGGLSWVYTLGGKQISCHWCCICHDFLYELGGGKAARKEADKLLRECAAKAGKFEGWRAPFRRGWRWFRSWVMYVAVRVFGGSHFNGIESDIK